jgi:hypothetical protein
MGAARDVGNAFGLNKSDEQNAQVQAFKDAAAQLQGAQIPTAASYQNLLRQIHGNYRSSQGMLNAMMGGQQLYRGTPAPPWHGAPGPQMGPPPGPLPLPGQYPSTTTPVHDINSQPGVFPTRPGAWFAPPNQANPMMSGGYGGYPRPGGANGTTLGPRQ